MPDCPPTVFGLGAKPIRSREEFIQVARSDVKKPPYLVLMDVHFQSKKEQMEYAKESIDEEDLETFLSTEMIEAVVESGRFELPKIEKVSYSAFTDPSGGRADSFTLAIAHRERDSKKIILDRLEERKPPFAPQDVAKEFSVILKSYGIYRVTGDRYAGEWVTMAFKEGGIRFEPSDLNKSEIYLEFEPLIAQGQVELLDNKRLFNQLRGLERRTRSGGKDSVDHYPGGHDDLANAAAGACVKVSKGMEYRPRITRL